MPAALTPHEMIRLLILMPIACQECALSYIFDSKRRKVGDIERKESLGIRRNL